MEREEGYYWVKYMGKWVIAKYWGKLMRWEYGIGMSDMDFDEIRPSVTRQPAILPTLVIGNTVLTSA